MTCLTASSEYFEGRTLFHSLSWKRAQFSGLGYHQSAPCFIVRNNFYVHFFFKGPQWVQFDKFCSWLVPEPIWEQAEFSCPAWSLVILHTLFFFFFFFENTGHVNLRLFYVCAYFNMDSDKSPWIIAGESYSIYQ